MPWKVTEVKTAREDFMAAWLLKKWTMTELCTSTGISRKTGYKWLVRFEAEGKPGLANRSSKPHTTPHAVSEELRRQILAHRELHPTWGPRLLLTSLHRKHPALPWPCPRTVHALLEKKGLVRKRTQRGRPPTYQSQEGYYGPNAMWCADFKGPMQSSKGNIEPFTVTDGTTRYLLAAEILKRKTHSYTESAFRGLFEQFGLPDAIRTDNGAPFSSVALAGLSELNIWFVKLGIYPVLGRPAHPQDNGRHERLHRTLEEDCRGPLRTSREPQAVLHRFTKMYNEERPHSSLSDMTPAEVYVASNKRMPYRLRDPEYGHDFFVERVSSKGDFWFMGQSFLLTPLLAKQLVGLRLQEDGQFDVRFGPIHLGEIAHGIRSASTPRGHRRFIPVT